jgi:hypothetical protein
MPQGICRKASCGLRTTGGINLDYLPRHSPLILRLDVVYIAKVSQLCLIILELSVRTRHASAE